MSYNNNTPIVEHIITTYKLICMFFRYLRSIIVLFVETPRKFITAKLSIRKPLYILSPCKPQGAQALVCISVVCFSVYLFYECLYIAF
jgi:hypothetical protein